ncbi:MAG: oxidoreductase [Gammaproteobacteria bacterium]|nr:oxidoreductase [Gammaproteobacteria bacterium]
MTFLGALVIVWYSIIPYWWLIAAMLSGLVLSYLLGRKRRDRPSPWLYVVSIVAGVAAALLAPYMTQSRLLYVATTPDYIALMLIAIVAAFYSWLLLKPLFQSARNR